MYHFPVLSPGRECISWVLWWYCRLRRGISLLPSFPWCRGFLCLTHEGEGDVGGIGKPEEGMSGYWQFMPGAWISAARKLSTARRALKPHPVRPHVAGRVSLKPCTSNDMMQWGHSTISHFCPFLPVLS